MSAPLRAVVFSLVAAITLIVVDHTTAIRASSPTTLPLVQPGDLSYLGAFRLPAGPDDQHSFSFGGTALAYNPTNNTLMMVGHDWYQRVAEVNIPTLVSNVSTVDALSFATLRQGFADVLQGHLGDVGSGTVKVGGLLPYGNQLIVSAFIYYDAQNTQVASHFVADANFSAVTPPFGPYTITNSLGKAGYVSGYMTPIPTDWQPLLGGTYLTGQCCISVLSRTSLGPSVTAFNPADLGVQMPAPGATLLGYPNSTPTLGAYGTSGGLFTAGTHVAGVIFPAGTRSVLFYGHRGTGTFCYGEGTADPALTGQPSPGGSIYCYDPVYPGIKGEHGYPYVHQVWAYDANDLAAVKQGTKLPWAVLPYAAWNFSLPFEVAGHIINGAAYDSASKRLFISAGFQDSYRPLIHAFSIAPGTSTTTSAPPPINPTLPPPSPPPPPPPATTPAAYDRGDFTGDGKPDLLWQDPSSGAAVVWQMNGTVHVSSTYVNAGGTYWQVVGTADFNGDGKPDILWQHPTTGAVLLWTMNGTTYVGSVMINSGGTYWKIVGVDDFNGDGKPDILWQHPFTGAVLAWTMDGTSYVGSTIVNAGGTYWQIVGTGDMTGDGKADILWQHPATGAVLLWQMNGTSYGSSVMVNTGGTYWKVVGVDDYTGDGKPDIVWQNPAGLVLIWAMNGTSYASGTVVTDGNTLWKIKGPK